MLTTVILKEVHFVFLLLWILPCLSGRPIRLAGLNSNQCSGRVEVFYRGTWGTVCGDQWDLNDAMVVCRELYCGLAQSADSSFGEGTGPIWFHEVDCLGSETSLTDCQYRKLDAHGCTHSQDAGVMCSGSDLRLTGSGFTRCSGRVELLSRGIWGTICDDLWDLKEANLVCRRLDCGKAVSVPSRAHFGQGTGPILLDDVDCSGSENTLDECPHKAVHETDCEHHEDAGVVCSDVSLPNVAPSGNASQSDTKIDYEASRAIDGDRNPDLSAGSCTHSGYKNSHWWSLRLPAVYRITHISISNRDIWPERIDNSEILIGTSPENNGNNNPRCTTIDTIPVASTRTFNCGGMIGQYVNVNRTGRTLTMCELEVYGEMAAPSFSAVVMGRSVEVVQKKLCWSDALFYCRDFYWDLLSMRSVEDQREVEKVLTNISFPLTQHVWLGLRRSLTSPSWFWMSGDPMNIDLMKKDSSWEHSSLCGGIDTSDHSHWKDFPYEEHNHFICLKDVQDDHERVMFFSSARPQTKQFRD